MNNLKKGYHSSNKRSVKPRISLTSRQKKLLASKEPSDFFTVFNEVHNAHLSTTVGSVEIKIDGEEKNND